MILSHPLAKSAIFGSIDCVIFFTSLSFFFHYFYCKDAFFSSVFVGFFLFKLKRRVRGLGRVAKTALCNFGLCVGLCNVLFLFN
jgi:hypothetical protein